MKSKKVVPVFFASDKNYVPYLTVAIKSLTNFTTDAHDYKLYILTHDLTEEDIAEIKSYEKSNVSVEIVDVSEKIETIKHKVALRDYYSVSIYFRLFIPSMFPQYDKAIYLDSDIVLNRDIADLYNVDIGFNYVGAILDETVFTNDTFIYYVNEALDVSEKQYFNSGVLSMNLKKFRDNKIEDDFYNWVNNYSTKFGSVAPDQDYLNCICKNKVKYFPLGWNKMPLASTLPDNELFLIHYNMFFKPWKYEKTMFEDYFWKYAKETSFYDLLKTQQLAYTEEKKKNDLLAIDNLMKIARNIADSGNNYKTLVLGKGKTIETFSSYETEEDEDVFDLNIAEEPIPVLVSAIKKNHR